jgi:tetratricopeptide (TPR) repeat protein
VLTQALWFSIPAALPLLGRVPPHGLASAIIWISAAHGAQYLWVTSYYARRQDPSLRLGPYLGRALLAGSVVTTLPALVLAPGLFGRVPWDVGLAVLVFAVVNLHHFVLDGAIWKLRDGRVARVLLREAEPAQRRPPAPARRRSGFRFAVAALGVVCLGINGFDAWEREVGVNRSLEDLPRLRRAVDRLAWIGRDPPALRREIGAHLAWEGQLDEALAEYRRSLELFPSVEAWIGIGRVEAHRGRWREALEAFEAALALHPDHQGARALVRESRMQLGYAARSR